ncbi:MAG: hypothetical protein ACK5MV_07785 [Aminipila sp.]
MAYFGEYEKFRYMMELREQSEKDCESNIARATHEGLESGISKGFEDGVKRTSLKIASNLKAKEFSNEMIVEVTGLTAEEVTAL